MLLGLWCALMFPVSLVVGLLCDAWRLVFRLGGMLLMVCGLLWLASLW
jgi:hypothetical protein